MVLSAVGAALGLGAYLLRRIGPTILAHAIFNGVVLIIVISGANQRSDFDFDDDARLAPPPAVSVVPLAPASEVPEAGCAHVAVRRSLPDRGGADYRIGASSCEAPGGGVEDPVEAR